MRKASQCFHRRLPFSSLFGLLVLGAVLLGGCAEFERMRQSPARQQPAAAVQDAVSAEDIPSQLDMADAARAMGHPEEAMAYLASVLGQDGNNPRALLGMGGIHLDQGQTHEAESAFNKVLASSPGNAGALEGLGRVELQSGDLLAAQARFQAGLAADPGRWQSLNGLGQIAAQRGQFSEAEGYYDRALAINPSSLELMTRLGYIKYRQGDSKSALALFDQVLAMHPAFRLAAMAKAELLVREGKQSEGLATLRLAMGEDEAKRVMDRIAAGGDPAATTDSKTGSHESQGQPLKSEAAAEGEKPSLLAFLLLIGAAVFVGAAGLLMALFPSEDRMEERRQGMGLVVAKPGPGQADQSLLKGVADTPWNRFTAAFLPRGEAAKHLDLGRLSKAGYRSLTALATYHTIRTVVMVFFPLLTIFLGTTLLGKSLQQLYLPAAVAFVVGMIGPSFVLDKKVEQRLTRLRNALPDALDLLVVCTESGLGLNAALLRVGHELRFVHPEFASELAVANGEIRAGLEREVALTNIVERTGLDDLKMLVMLLIQSTKLGTSLAETLRIYAEEFRDKRMQAAEEQAAQLSTKIIFPLVFCFMPTFFIVAVGPAFSGVFKALK